MVKGLAKNPEYHALNSEGGYIEKQDKHRY
jgi:hypothetical protein